MSVISKTMNRTNRQSKRLGRKPTDDSERMRVAVWYCRVNARGWSDYDLDLEFENESGIRRSDPENRNRIFERARTNRSLPKQKASETHLVMRVEAHEQFRGTASVYCSAFWTLMLRGPVSLLETRAFVGDCLAQMNIKRLAAVSPHYRKIWNSFSTTPRDRLPSQQELEKGLLDYLLAGRETSLDVLGLVGSLCREAYLTCALERALFYSREYGRLLTEFVAQDWLRPIATEFEYMAKERLLHWHFCSEDETRDLEDWLPTPLHRLSVISNR